MFHVLRSTVFSSRKVPEFTICLIFYSGFNGLNRYFSDTKKFITRVGNMILTPFRGPKFRLDATVMSSLFLESQF